MSERASEAPATVAENYLFGLSAVCTVAVSTLPIGDYLVAADVTVRLPGPRWVAPARLPPAAHPLFPAAGLAGRALPWVGSQVCRLVRGRLGRRRLLRRLGRRLLPSPGLLAELLLADILARKRRVLAADPVTLAPGGTLAITCHPVRNGLLAAGVCVWLVRRALLAACRRPPADAVVLRPRADRGHAEHQANQRSATTGHVVAVKVLSRSR